KNASPRAAVRLRARAETNDVDGAGRVRRGGNGILIPHLSIDLIPDLFRSRSRRPQSREPVCTFAVSASDFEA
ncbi:MAG TPA: hypothetical protein VIQ54_26830, partial [Polyangia bacterium]